MPLVSLSWTRGSDILCPHWGNHSLQASPRVGDPLSPPGHEGPGQPPDQAPQTEEGPLCRCPAPLDGSGGRGFSGPEEVGRCMCKGRLFRGNSLPAGRKVCCGRDVAALQGCSQRLATDSCKYGSWNLAPVLPSLSLLPAPSILGVRARWWVGFCSLSAAVNSQASVYLSHCAVGLGIWGPPAQPKRGGRGKEGHSQAPEKGAVLASLASS